MIYSFYEKNFSLVFSITVQFILLIVPQLYMAHSWLDCIGHVDAKYSGQAQYFSDNDFKELCFGYPRNYPGRMNRDINTLYTYFVSGRDKKANLCHSSQNEIKYTDEYKMTVIDTDSYDHKLGNDQNRDNIKLKLWWEMDNHPNPTTNVTVYYANKPNTRISLYGDLSNRGKKEYQINKQSMIFASKENCFDLSKPNTLCWGYLNIPRNVQKGVYSMYWMWHWNQNPIGEEFTTCFDVEIK